MDYRYASFHVGGDPDKVAFLAEELNDKIYSIQRDGWIIDNVSHIENTRAWSMRGQKYVSTTEYIIIAKREKGDSNGTNK